MSDSALEQKVIEIIDGIRGLAEPAMQVTLSAMRAGAIMDLAFAALLFSVSLIVVFRVLPGFWKDLQESDYSNELSRGARFWVTFVLTAFVGIASACTLVSTNLWLSVIAPEFALARALVAKAI